MHCRFTELPSTKTMLAGGVQEELSETDINADRKRVYMLRALL